MTSLAFVLRLNAASCLGFGALFAFIPAEVAAILGNVPPTVLFWVGIALLFNGGHLALVSLQTQPGHAQILWFSLGDFAWWLASLFLIATGIWITTPLGITLAMLVGIGVAGLGTMQLFLLGLERSGLDAAAHWRRIGRSWLSLPIPVKAWLIALNAVFLAAPVLMPWDSAVLVLIAYAASGPPLLGFAVYAGGLTRAMGIGHLVPWTPMLAWLAMEIHMFAGNPVAFGYAIVLTTTVTACLAFDLYDIVRWACGERDIILASDSIENSAAE